MASQTPELNAIACRRCRQKKIRCDREKPACKGCRQLSADCVYEPPRYGKRKRGTISGNHSNPSIPGTTSYIPDILNRLDALESAIRTTAVSPISPLSTNSSNLSASNTHNDLHVASDAKPSKPSARETLLKSFKFHADPATLAADERITISLETAVSWIRALYDNLSTLGLLLAISKDFMLTIPSIVDNPYVQVDVRVIILYYGALHHGMLLSPGLSASERNKYALFFYRKTLQHMEHWLRQDNVTELSLHVAFWMVSPNYTSYPFQINLVVEFALRFTKMTEEKTHQAYSQLDFDLSHRLHGYACQIAQELGLFRLDARISFPSSSPDESLSRPPENPLPPLNTMGTVYRDVHRIYFWHILVTNDLSFRHHHYRSSNIDPVTWRIDLPDSSIRKSLSNIDRDTEVFFEASLRLTLTELKFSELEKGGVLCKSVGDFLVEADQVRLRNLLTEIESILSEWQIEQLMLQASSEIYVWLYAHLIWRSTSMISRFLRVRLRSAIWPTKHDKELEHRAAHRSIKALRHLFEFGLGGLYWNLGYFKCLFTPCLGVLFGNILTSDSKSLAVSDLALTSWVHTIVSKVADGRSELKSLETLLETLNDYAQVVIQKKFAFFESQTSLQPDTQGSRSIHIEDSDTGLPSYIAPTSLHEDEVEFLTSNGLDVAELLKEPMQAVLTLQKGILTEPDPHRQWWDFESGV